MENEFDLNGKDANVDPERKAMLAKLQAWARGDLMPNPTQTIIRTSSDIRSGVREIFDVGVNRGTLQRSPYKQKTARQGKSVR